MAVTVTKILDNLVLAEGPHWDAEQQALFFVDLPSNTILKYTPTTGQTTSAKFENTVSHIVPVEGTKDQFVVGSGRKILVLKWDGVDGSKIEVVKEVGEVDQHEPDNQFNDGKADSRGRLYTGTLTTKMGKCKGSVYRVDGGKITKVGDNVTCANGIAFDLKERAMYYVDSMEYNIRRYDYDVETGDLSNMTHIFDFKEKGIEGFPDGCTIDTDGNLWVAVFGGSCVLNMNPRTGEVIRKVELPVKQVTSATFGGPNYDTLFVTASGVIFDGFELAKDSPPTGDCLFTVTGLGVKGHPNCNFKL